MQHSVRLLENLIRKWGSDEVKAAINYNIEHTEQRVREEVNRWPDGSYEADVFVDHDTIGSASDIRVHVTCIVAGEQLTVDLTGTDDRPDLVGVWNTFANSRGYVMTQIVAAMDPSINKNEGFFNAVDIIIPEGCIAHPPPNKPAALGSFHPACEITEAVCVALSDIVPERSAPQVYKMGMPNASAYAATKAALDAMTKVMAQEWAPLGIRVNALAPGTYHSDLTDGLSDQQMSFLGIIYDSVVRLGASMSARVSSGVRYSVRG